MLCKWLIIANYYYFNYNVGLCMTLITSYLTSVSATGLLCFCHIMYIMLHSYTNFILWDKNYFMFEDKYFLTETGCRFKLSPDCERLLMGYLEERYIWDNNPLLDNIVLWIRYVDDVFCSFKGSRNKLDNFTLHLNNMVDSIKLNIEVDTCSVSFLEFFKSGP